MFYRQFSEIIKSSFVIIKDTFGQLLLNAKTRKYLPDCWSKVSLFSPLRFLIFNDSILVDFLKTDYFNH